MERLFIRTFDAIKISEESKQKIKDRLIEYQNNLAISKNKKCRRKFFWTTPRIVTAASTIVVLIFCAIFFPIMAFNGGGDGQDMAAIYKTNLLAAVNQLKVVDSYVEEINITMLTNEITTDVKYTTKYKKDGKGYIAEGLTKTDGFSQKFYYIDGYMYMPVDDSGVKIRINEEFTSFVQFFSKNSGYLTSEKINQLNKESDMKKTDKLNGNSLYSFKLQNLEMGDGTGDAYYINSDYVVTIESESGRMLEIRQSNLIEVNGQSTIANLSAEYNYVAVEINLPDNLDTYLEYMG